MYRSRFTTIPFQETNWIFYSVILMFFVDQIHPNVYHSCSEVCERVHTLLKTHSRFCAQSFWLHDLRSQTLMCFSVWVKNILIFSHSHRLYHNHIDFKMVQDIYNSEKALREQKKIVKSNCRYKCSGVCMCTVHRANAFMSEIPITTAVVALINKKIMCIHCRRCHSCKPNRKTHSEC